MRRVIIERPYASSTRAGVKENVAYARRCLRDSLMRGEAPIASHLLYTQPGVLDDKDSAERALGIAAGHAWGVEAVATVVYLDRGVTEGMRQGMIHAEFERRPVEQRYLGEGPETPTGIRLLSPKKRSRR